MNNILDGTKYKDRPIDFLTVDAEGHDYQILSSLDFQRYQPKLIAVETHKTTLDEVMKEDLYLYLTSLGYIMVNWVGLTLLFRRKENQPALP